ncbi:MAG: molybdopterin converting factor subunit 1 [Pseudomonadota bacterium]
MVTMRYFAWVRDKIGKDSEELELPAAALTASDLIDWLAEQGDEYAFLSEQKLVVRLAVDQQLVALDEEIGNGTEIAVFPPMTGG